MVKKKGRKFVLQRLFRQAQDNALAEEGEGRCRTSVERKGEAINSRTDRGEKEINVEGRGRFPPCVGKRGVDILARSSRGHPKGEINCAISGIRSHVQGGSNPDYATPVKKKKRRSLGKKWPMTRRGGLNSMTFRRKNGTAGKKKGRTTGKHRRGGEKGGKKSKIRSRSYQRR